MTHLSSRACRLLAAYLLSLMLWLYGPLAACAQALNTPVKGRPVREALNSDGTLQTGISGSFDVAGYRLSTAAGGRPVLRPTGPGDDHWQDGFPVLGADGSVRVILAAPNGVMYVGGSFTAVGGVPANRVARWDGSSWSAVGTGFEFQSQGIITIGPVEALALAPGGGIYASVTHYINSQPYGRVQHWNGSQWTRLGGSNMNSKIWTLAVAPNGDVFAGGDFGQIGTVRAAGIARWDGTAWQSLGAGATTYLNKVVVAPNGTIYGSGYFFRAGAPTDYVARWNGTAWAALGTGVGGFVYDMALLPGGDLVIVGDFYGAGGQSAPKIARWDGTAWNAVGAGLPWWQPMAVAVTAGGELFVASEEYQSAGDLLFVSHWDGTTWQTVAAEYSYGGRADKPGLAVATTGDVYFGRSFSEFVGAPAANIARWDGAAWHGLGTGINAPVRGLCVAPDGSVYIAGSFTEIGGVAARGVARWDGTTWTALGAGIEGRPATVVAGPAGAVYVSGTFTQAGGQSANNVARWDGTSWYPLGAGGNGRVGPMAVASNGDLYAVGYFGTGPGQNNHNVARWDGTTWTPLGTGTTGLVKALLLVPGGDVYAGGFFNTMGGVPAANIARWDGTAWHPLGAGLDDAVQALAVGPAGEVYAGGSFQQAGGGAAQRIARWDGTSWYPLAGGINDGNVRALATTAAGELYVGGRFTYVNGQPVSEVARWDGTTWTSLGTGLAGCPDPTRGLIPNVNSLGILLNGDVVAAGTFSTVGDGSKVSAYFGRYQQQLTGLPAQVPVADNLLVFPNPAHTSVQVSATPSCPRVVIVDLTGRAVRDTLLTSGKGTLDVSGLPAGLYFLRAGITTHRLIVE